MNNTNYYYISSYPKSGNTWCRIFISEYLNFIKRKKSFSTEISKNDAITIEIGKIMSNRSWIDDQIGIDSSDLTREELDKVRSNIGLTKKIFDEDYRFHKVHDSFYKPKTRINLVPYKNCNGVIYLIRHPADVAISLSYFRNTSYKDAVNFLMDENSILGGENNKLSNQVYQYLGSWNHHVKSWTEQQKIPILVIRYEDLISNSEKFFTKILKFVKLPINEEILSQTINCTKFSRLQKLEEKFGFNEKPQSCKRFFRSGKCGEGKEKLSNQDYLKLLKRFKKILRKFDYN